MCYTPPPLIRPIEKTVTFCVYGYYESILKNTSLY